MFDLLHVKFSAPRAAGLVLAVCSLAAVAQQQTTAPQNAPEESKCSIQGQVTNANTKEPLKKATVLLVNIASPFKPVTAETDDAGKFAFKDLDPGKYYLMGERNGFARQMYGARGNPLAGTTITLITGQQLKDIAFKMTPNAVISGRVFDEDGEPVNNVTVMCLRTAYMRGKRQLMPAGGAQTNDLGEYRIANLTAGRYYISATYRNLGIGLAGTSAAKPPGDKPEMGFIPTYYPNATDYSTIPPLVVAAGAEVRGTDIRLIKARVVRVKGKLGPMPQGRTVVVMLSPRGAGMAGLVSRNIAIAQAGEGNFEFKNVTPGSYVISALSAEDQQALGAAHPIEVADQNIAGISVSMSSSVEIQGKLSFDSDNPPDLKNTEVMLEPTDMIGMSVPRTKPEKDYTFRFKNVIPDKYTVRLVGSGAQLYYLKSARSSDEDVLESGLDVKAGAGPSIEITIGVSGAQITGAVRDEDDQPISGVSVALIPDSHKYIFYKDVTTDQSGNFSIKGIAPGEYKIFAFDAIEMNAFQDPEFVKPYESKGEALSVKANDQRSLQLKLIKTK